MDFDKKDGLSYLDNIPFKISSAFLPPAPVVLPTVLNTEGGFVFEEYDFSKERQVLEDIRKRSEAAAAASLPSSSNGQDSSVQKSNLKSIFPLQSDILLPKTQKHLDKVSNALDGQHCSKINLSDFENDTSSPFDDMELQTINDLEELSNVFQGLNNKYSSDDNVCNRERSDSESLGAAANCVSKSMSFPLENNDAFETSEKCLRQCPDSSDSFDPVVVPSSSEVRRRSLACSSETLTKVPCVSSSSSVDDPLLQDSKSGSALRGCKSYSDLHGLLTKQNSEDVPSRSSTPPSTVVLTAKSSDAPVHENEVSPNCDNASLSLPDPYHELTEEEKRFVDAIADMGFPRAQVSRSVKHLGSDEKTVVEHLCQIQVLEESGYDCLEAEAALHLHDYNQDQAKNFLDLITKFQDLGFEKNAVKKALIQNKNDWGKTIDALLS